MNKQEAIEKIEDNLMYEITRHIGKAVNIYDVTDIVKQIDEPEKQVVPQFVADWIEWCKKNNVTLLGAMSPIDELGTAICDDKEVESLDASRWATRNQETFAKAWLYGYEIEKEKLYTVEIPNPNAEERPILYKKRDGKVQIIFPSVPCWRTVKNAQLTESEIKQDFAWAWKFAEEVEV